MLNVEVLNRPILTFMDREREFYPMYNWALIRFFNTASPYKLTLPESCKDHLEITCDDVTNVRVPNAHLYTFFSVEHAQKILNFVEKNKDRIDTLICACEAGISRSAGCAAAIEKIYLGTDEIYNNIKYFPNSLIYSTILNLYYYKDDYEKSNG